MRRAIIDLGTNTFNLLIADVDEMDFSVIHTEKEAVMLGMGGINEGTVAEDAQRRALDTLIRFAQACEYHGVHKEYTLCFGTSALRSAKNAMELTQRVKNKLGWTINIISGDLEAELIYKGVRWSYAFDQRAVIMDIGGGSTEFIWANDHGVEKAISLDIGVSRVFQQLDQPEEFEAEDRMQTEDFFNGRHQFSAEEHCDILIGASGSFETFYEMVHERRFVYTRGLAELELDELKKVLDWVIRSSYEDRLDHEWIVPIRKRMLPIAAMKVRWVIEKLKVKKVYVSANSLKEGALWPDRTS